jgi:hypothetical protein
VVGAKQLVTQDLSWFWPGAVRPTVVCSGHYITLHRGACSGAATSKAGEEPRGLQVPGGVIEMSSDVVGELCVVRFGCSCLDVSCPVSPAARGFTFLL